MDVVIKNIIVLKIPAQQASAKAPLGPTLGQFNIPIAEFCNRYNELTQFYENGIILKCIITLYSNYDYNIDILYPDITFLIKKTLLLENASSFPKKIKFTEQIEYNSIINSYLLYELGIVKYNLLKVKEISYQSFYKRMKGTLRSMGIIYIPALKME